MDSIALRTHEGGRTERAREGAQQSRETEQENMTEDRRNNILRQISSTFSSVDDIGSPNNALQDRKLQKQFILVEEEIRELRAKNANLESELHKTTFELEAMKATARDLEEQNKDVNARIAEELEREKIRMAKEIAAYRSQHAYELQLKDKKIQELENEIVLIRRQGAHAIERFHSQLEEAKEQIISLKKSEGALEVYKKRLSEMSNLKAELTQSQDQVQRLTLDLQSLSTKTVNESQLEQTVQRLRKDIEKIKLRSESKELELQEATFELKDARTRIKGFEQKESFLTAQIEKLTSETSQLQEELILTKEDRASNAMAETQKADLKDQYNSLLMENKALKTQINLTMS